MFKDHFIIESSRRLKRLSPIDTGCQIFLQIVKNLASYVFIGILHLTYGDLTI